MISYSYHVCIKIKFIPPLCLSLTSGGGGGLPESVHLIFIHTLSGVKVSP